VDRNGYGQNGGDSFVLIYHLPVRFKGVFLNYDPGPAFDLTLD